MEPDQQIEVILRIGSQRKFRVKDLGRAWIQECHSADIRQFRIVNPKDDWLIVPQNHFNENCPIAVVADQFTEIEFSDGKFDTTYNKHCWYLWPQDKKGMKIVKFRLVK